MQIDLNPSLSVVIAIAIIELILGYSILKDRLRKRRESRNSLKIKIPVEP